MRASTAPVLLAEYAPPVFNVLHVALHVILHPTRTRVVSRLVCERQAVSAAAMHLDGDGLELGTVRLNGQPMEKQHVDHTASGLLLSGLPQGRFELEIEQFCNPQGNTALSGLYLSRGTYCTQMEAEGFRRFAFFPDRPDIMATYEVTIDAPVELPVLLSNGNPVSHAALPGTGLHRAVWNDPHPKPSYLFALVAGDLACVTDSFRTADGRNVTLGICVEHGKQDRCAFAMQALKQSMAWDETRFGRIYDLDVFNIVAVSDFNMGAMENKGLNIFNDKYILALPETATDADYINIERIIAHEYFHNWTGNRITCRDWFQLCLKEGLTVYRDQEFTSDVRSRAVKRIEDVRTLRARQFPEDQGPLAHAVRPASYIEINNFYTPTVYEKGAELCRMLHTLLGADTFSAALDIYFARHDGQAATVEQFLRCMADASGRDLTQFALWYAQAGTPRVEAQLIHDASHGTAKLTLRQHTPPTPGQPTKLPLHMPLSIALLDGAGQTLPLILESGETLADGLIELTEAEQHFTFINLPERPRMSINRGFTAPIVLSTNASDDDLLFLARYERDAFSRWEATQTCMRKALVAASNTGTVDASLAAGLAQSLSAVLNSNDADDAFKGLMLQFPSEAEIAGSIGSNVNASAVHDARKAVLRHVAGLMQDDLQRSLAATQEHEAYAPDVRGTGRRALRYASLALLAHVQPAAAAAIAQQDFADARSMTHETGAISALLGTAPDVASHMLNAFMQRHEADHLLMDKWFMMQAALDRPEAAAAVSALTAHPAFRWQTPNRVYALLGGFAAANTAALHAVDGSGYALIADAVITLNGVNPQVAARVAGSFRSWKIYDTPRRLKAEQEMRRILREPGLSRDVFEIITRTLG